MPVQHAYHSRIHTSLINAGADLLCILEPTASYLGPSQFERFSAAYVRHIIENYKYAGVDTIYHICGNTMHLIEAMSRSGVAAISLDSPQTGVDMVRPHSWPGRMWLLWEVNPTVVMKKARRNRSEPLADLFWANAGDSHIPSTGCDLPPGVPLENMLCLYADGQRNLTETDG